MGAPPALFKMSIWAKSRRGLVILDFAAVGGLLGAGAAVVHGLITNFSDADVIGSVVPALVAVSTTAAAVISRVAQHVTTHVTDAAICAEIALVKRRRPTGRACSGTRSLR